ncbi:MAG: metallophosphoesterase [Lachnospiraceae bacterium]|nr:metallophosphoesterase [Lachnospiraceae bacterium]
MEKNTNRNVEQTQELQNRKAKKRQLGKKGKIILAVSGLVVILLAVVGFGLWKNKESFEFAVKFGAEYKNASGVSFTDPTHQLATKERVVGTVSYAENGNYIYADGLPRTFSALVKLEEGARGGVIYGNNIGAMGSYLADLDFVNFQITADGYPQLFLRDSNSYTGTATLPIDVRGKDWVLITAVYDDDRQQVDWYLNGELAAAGDSYRYDFYYTSKINSEKWNTLPVINSYVGVYDLLNTPPYQAMKVGGDYTFTLDLGTKTSTYNENYFTGEIAYISSWTTVRTAEEIRFEAKALQADATDVPTEQNGLLTSWSFSGDGDILSTIYEDQSGRGYDVIPYCELVSDLDEQYLSEQNISTEIAEGDYRIVVIPDIQNINRDVSGCDSALLDEYVQWIVDHKEEYNIVGYLCMGDLTQNSEINGEGLISDQGKIKAEWERAASVFEKLDEAGIPGLPMRGNHDRSALFNQYFPADEWSEKEYFGGLYEEDYFDVCYWYMDAGEREYLVFSLGWSVGSFAAQNYEGLGNTSNMSEMGVNEMKSVLYNEDVIRWVNEVIDAHPEHHVIITSHNGLNWEGNLSTDSGSDVFWEQVLSEHDNVVMAFSGHHHNADIAYNYYERGDGEMFPYMLMDGQATDQYEGAKGFMGIITLNNDSNDAFVNWYSVRDESLYREKNQFEIVVPH